MAAHFPPFTEPKQTPTGAYDARRECAPRGTVISAIDNLCKAVDYLQWAVTDLRKHALSGMTRADLPPNLAAAILRDAGIGDVPRHPMQAEADRIAEGRL